MNAPMMIILSCTYNIFGSLGGLLCCACCVFACVKCAQGNKSGKSPRQFLNVQMPGQAVPQQQQQQQYGQQQQQQYGQQQQGQPQYQQNVQQLQLVGTSIPLTGTKVIAKKRTLTVEERDTMTNELSVFLGGIKLEKYVSVLAQQNIDVETLKMLSKEELIEVGIPLGAALKIMKAATNTNIV